MKLHLDFDKTPIILFGGSILLCWLLVMPFGIFGSQIDWISQHSVFPDYFRQLFYSTGSLFPNFAPQLGGGQSLFHFSYYGLFNPVILLSYFLPFVKMSDYVMWSSMCCYGLSVALFYLWIRHKCSSRKMAVGIACMFALSGSLMYHFYNQVMFVNYMPFLCIALIGTDRYLKERRSGLLIAGTVGMILSSFYFSIGGMLALVMYAVSEYCKGQERIRVRGLLGWTIGYGCRLLLSVLLCSILLVPTVCALGGGRERNAQMSLSLFLPELAWEKLLYHPHGIGLSVSALIVLVRGLFYKNWRERLLSVFLIVLLVFPIFGFLLNGGLYSKTKVFIPFLPLVCYLYIPCLNALRGKKEWMRTAVPYTAAAILFVVSCGIQYVARVMVPRDVYREVTSTKADSTIEEKTSADDTLYRFEELGNGSENKANINRVHTLEQSISSIYSSVYSTSYAEFRRDTFELNEPFRNDMMQPVTDNPCFLQLMGVKYLLTEETIPGYTSVASNTAAAESTKDVGESTETGSTLLTNEAALPIIYTTNHLISEKQYSSYAFPENQTALLQAAVVQESAATASWADIADTAVSADAVSCADMPDTAASDSGITQVFQRLDVSLTDAQPAGFALEEDNHVIMLGKDGCQITKTEEGYEINAQEETMLLLPVSMGANRDLLAVSFDVENLQPDKDVAISIEQQKNLLTSRQHEYANHNERFTYLLGVEKGTKQIRLTLGKGHYILHQTEFYAGSWQGLGDTGLCQHAFEPTNVRKQWSTDWDGSCMISGTLEAEEDSALITSIPYDEGFSILIDGKKVTPEIVNTAFLGCPIAAGVHQVEIRYQAKGFRLGALLTLFSAGLCILLFGIGRCMEIQFFSFKKRKSTLQTV